MFRTFWHDLLLPLLRRPALVQAAALCWRPGPDGPEILLITSRDTGRWVVPKGWLKKGMDGAGTAAEEAWEEAGVITEQPLRPLGAFRYMKTMRSGLPLNVRCQLFALRVARLDEDFPERDERSLAWMSPDEAARSVREPDLAALIRDFRLTGKD